MIISLGFISIKKTTYKLVLWIFKILEFGNVPKKEKKNKNYISIFFKS